MNGTTYSSHICPWDTLQPATLPFCEARICGWIVEPANAWSNIFVVLAGILMIMSVHRSNRKHLQLIGPCTVFMGVGSFFLHASATFTGQIVDLMGMLLVLSAFLDALLRMHWNSSGRTRIATFLFGTIVPSTLSCYFEFAGILLFALLLTGLFLLTLKITTDIKNEFHLPSYNARFVRSFLWGSALLLIAFSAWLFDVTGYICNPDNHWFNGHALWHVLAAAATWKFFQALDRISSDGYLSPSLK